MTRKDFVAIATAIKDHPSTATANVATDLADYLATTNPRFDRARFLKACGVIGS